LLLIAILIKLDSPGPVFFRQTRVGRGGEPFRIHKFRTMTSGTGSRDMQLTVGADPRITRTGRWLRKYKLDELAQLIDVVQGSMSLVGPRPEVPEYVAHYPAETRQIVLSVRPGITDNAAIEYRDENDILAQSADPEREYIEKILPAKLEHYRHYVAEHSLPGDIAIILRTLGAVFR
jgi:lipopolysaccharide/colanic/teichoic acid biosynthesis glycosyltransferase